MSASAVLCVGRVYCDLVFTGLQHFPEPGDEVYAQHLSLHTGGGAAITAHYLANLQRTVELCANLPASPFAKVISDELGSSVNLRYCSVEQSDDPQITVVLTGEQDRSFVTRRVSHALPENYSHCLQQYKKLGAIQHLHVGELATLLDYPDLIPFARAAAWTISLDCAWDLDALGNPAAKQLIADVDIFMPNESELKQLEQIDVTANSAPLTVLKKGADGALAFSASGVTQATATAVNCIDATGAGDAFNAGFIDAWLRDEPIATCLDLGNRCGAQAVSHLGGINLVSDHGLTH